MSLDPDATGLDHPTLDHVAVAVTDMATAGARWQARGATYLAALEEREFATSQLRFPNLGKVELISSGAVPGFIDAYLQRFGPGRIHHLTLKVAGPLSASVDRLRAAGLDVVDVTEVDANWHESFLRPSQVGGVIVQVAWAALDDEGFAREYGMGAPPPVDPSAPSLERIVLGHHDLAHAMTVWRLLGAELETGGDRFIARWPTSPMAVEVRKSAADGPLGLVLDPPTVVDATDWSPPLLAPDD